MPDPVACCVLLCPSSEQSRSLRSVCFFDFPHPNDPRYPVWIERSLRAKDWTPSPTSKICSRHFRPEDILTLRHADGSGRTEKRVKYDALPSVFEAIPDSMRPPADVVPRADSPEIILASQGTKKRSIDCLDENNSDETQKESSDSLSASAEVAQASANVPSNFPHANLTVLLNNCTTPKVAIPVAKRARNLPPPVVIAPKPIPSRPDCSLAQKIVDGRLTVLDHCARHVPVDYPALTDADEARKCCVPGCFNARDNNPRGRILFHAFPSDKQFQTEWIKRVACSSFWQPAPYSVVCSFHFLSSDYGYNGKIWGLKPTAIPSQLGCRNGLMRKLNGPCLFSRVCAICGCWRVIKQTPFYKSASRLAFTPFPEAPHERQKWLAACPEVSGGNELYACERHFVLADILARFEQDREMKLELQRRDGILPHPSFPVFIPFPLENRAPPMSGSTPAVIGPLSLPMNSSNSSQSPSNEVVLQSRTITATPSALLIQTATPSASPGGFTFLVVPNQTAIPVVPSPIATPPTGRFTRGPSRKAQPKVAMPENELPTCSQCGLRFSTDVLCRIHEYEHGGKEIAEDLRRTTACAACGEPFESLDALVKHTKIHGKPTEECPVCKRRFHALNYHIRRCHPDCHSPHRCAQCGKEFQSRAHYHSHLMSHKVKNFWANRTCSDCNLRFDSESVCRLHRIHHGNAELMNRFRDTRECPECHQRFAALEELVEHVSEHGKAAEKCPVCGDWYIYLSIHMRRDHPSPVNAACCVPGCRNVRQESSKTAKVLFFQFVGANDPRYKTWTRRLRYNSSWVPDSSERICSDHFRESEIESHKNGSRLARTALPSQLSCTTSLCGFTAADMAAGAIGCAVCGLRPPGDISPKASEKLKFFRAPGAAADGLRNKWVDFCSQQRDDIDWTSIGADTPWFVCENHFEEKYRKAEEELGSVVSESKAIPSLPFSLDVNYTDQKLMTSKTDYGNSLLRKGVFCCVPGCETVLKKGDPRVGKFFDFLTPANARYEEWLRMVRYNASWVPEGRARICPEHFPASAIKHRMMYSQPTVRLRQSAFPTQLSCMESLCTFTPADMIAGKVGCAVCGLRPFPSKRRLKASEKLEFYRAPLGEIREKWIEFCKSQRTDVDWSAIAEETPWFLCENHFDAQNKAEYAAQTAIPSLSFSIYIKSKDLEPTVTPKKKTKIMRRQPVCCVPGCRKFTWDKTPPARLRYFKWSKVNRNEWTNRIRCSLSWRPITHSFVCSRHFRPEDFCETTPDEPLKAGRLRLNVAPSVLDCLEEYHTPVNTDALVERDNVRTCCVCGCWRPLDETDLIPSERLNFFPFPDDDRLRHSWLTACRQWNPHLTVSKESLVCENHFLLDNLTRLLEDGKETKLVPKSDAISTEKTFAKLPVRLNKPDTVVRNSSSTITEGGSGYKCCVPGCGNRAKVEGKKEKITFHVFPGLGISSRFREWMNRIRCAISWKPDPHSRVCSKHFCPEDFMEETSKGKQPRTHWLKRDAVPSILQCVEKFRSPLDLSEPVEVSAVRRCCVCGWWRAAKEKCVRSEILTFFSFPSDEDQRTKWVEICREWNHDFVFSAGLLVCENHFQLGELTLVRASKWNQQLTLRSDAVPSERCLRLLGVADDLIMQGDSVDAVAPVSFDGSGEFSSFDPEVDTADDDDESETGSEYGVYAERSAMSAGESAWEFEAAEDDDSIMEADDTDTAFLDVTNSVCVPLRMSRIAENGLPEDEHCTSVGAVHGMPSVIPFTTDEAVEMKPPSPPRCAPDDALMYCDCCHKFLPTPCWLHAASVCDEPVVPLSVGSLPKMLYLDVCDDSLTGKAVFTKEVIARHTVFGPLIAPLAPGHSEKALYFSVTEEQRRYYELESDYACNWMKHVRFADSLQNSNLLVFSRGSQVVFVTIKTVAPHEELKVWYSKQYLEVMDRPGKTEVEDIKLEPEDGVDGTFLPCDDHVDVDMAEAVPWNDEANGSSPVEAVCVSHLPIENGSSLPVTVDGDYRQTDDRSRTRSKPLLSKTKRTNKTRNFFTRNICSECNVRFRREDMLRLHQFNHTGCDDGSERDCPECAKHFDEFPALLKHVDEHGTPLVQCPVCNETCSSGAVLVHLHRYHPGYQRRKLWQRGLNCDKCGLRFASSFLYRLHQLGHQDKECVDSIKITRKCPECGEIFDSLDKLAEHVDVHGKLTKKCPVCKGYYPGMKKHIERHHPEYLAETSCPECGKEFAQPFSLIVHMRCHGKRAALNRSTCQQCGLQFAKDSLYVLHKTSHDTTAYRAISGTQKCPECDETFDDMAGLFQHIVTHAVAAQKCPECSLWVGSLRMHLKRQHPETPRLGHLVRFRKVTCVQCGLRFSTGFLRSIHEYEHGSKELAEDMRSRTACAECAEEFEDFEALVKHVKIHGRETEECPVCKRRFYGLNGHIRREHPDCPYRSKEKCGDGPHQCRECGKEFASAAVFARHVNGHRTSAALAARTCSDCGLRFKSDDVCQLHEIHHGKEKSAETIQGTPECPECHQNFERLEELAEHVSEHGRATEKCPVCGEWYSALAVHVRRDHPDYLNKNPFTPRKSTSDGLDAGDAVDSSYKCSNCGKQFDSRISFVRHVVSHRASKMYSSLTCSDCGLRFNSEMLCRLHEIQHGNAEALQTLRDTRECPECDDIFAEWSQLVEHVAQHGRPTEKCPICGEWYSQLKKHTRRDHPDHHFKLFERPTSGIENGSSREEGSPEHLHKCPKCSKEFTSRFSLSAHISSHRAKEVKYGNLTCNDCGLRFGSEAVCDLHRMQHADKDDSSDHVVDVDDCPQCGESFQDVTQLVEHVAVHGRRTDKCPVCGQWYAALRDHIRRDHNEHFADFVAQEKSTNDTPKARERGGYPCEKCGKQLFTRSSYDLHIRVGVFVFAVFILCYRRLI
ncbi:uncharacterized protein LOC129585445 [Paramacrobiotus metropolitanus]|uniref:uncharacterized protein LOC129585445 n=1 Tax=Paramacrobiotus metropolitanus TaxID=2943436 RepID=UPI00244648DD|nr:uncharacterized protein LOC129585445 [Paramacrobiotus metropolitanus]